MINFSGISNVNFLGKILRIPLNLLPKNLVFLILQGKLKGKKWIIGSANHGCWLGSYEMEKQSLFSKTIKNGDCVYDIGANAGFYTLLASVLVGESGKVVSFEPLPGNFRYLSRHVKINKCNNVEIVEAAVGDRKSEVFFKAGLTGETSHLDKHGDIKVKMVKLDDMVKNGLRPPDYIKIDVEGAELLVLQGAMTILTDFSPIIFLATHSKELFKECNSFLRFKGYDLHEIPGMPDEVIASKKTNK